MSSNFITIKHQLINLSGISHIQLRKKSIHIYFGNSKITLNMKNASNAEKQFNRIGEILNSSVMDISEGKKKPKDKKKAEGKKKQDKSDKQKTDIAKPE